MKISQIDLFQVDLPYSGGVYKLFGRPLVHFFRCVDCSDHHR